ncbi:MAG: lysophospholipid acyltransferase family protein [Pyrinomonadaceae bacterium]|nr:lysophospholipid acyltransferase family protein [Pyrinomonadaceae bacterium]MCX7640397.1 lysophospholipid acyltransferase family protein [Pyrinomonadaceae bacterium]MDW8304825.1 lysophospholipid acyltransferase family protein [Acidobacteriota bacterium]
MIKASKNVFFEKVFAFYNRNLIDRRFNTLRVAGLENLDLVENLPCLVYANHSSWWDGLIAYEISLHTKLDWFVMMQESQLRKYFFFRWLGAFSVPKHSPKQALKSLEYASNLMKQNKRCAILIFPQGKIEPNDIRPIKIQSGVVRIVQAVEDLILVPLAFRYEFLEDFKPEAFAKVGNSEVIRGTGVSKSTLKAKMQQELTELLDSIRNDILQGKFDEYKRLV